jgi:hypothetical protein
VPEDEQAKPAPDPDPGIVGGNTARAHNFDVVRLTAPARSPIGCLAGRVGLGQGYHSLGDCPALAAGLGPPLSFWGDALPTETTSAE